MPLLEPGTVISLPAGTVVQIAGQTPLVDLRLTGSAMAVLEAKEDLLPSASEVIRFPRGAYVRLSTEAQTDGAVLAVGTSVFVLQGSTATLVKKATTGGFGGQVVCAPCESPLQTVGLMFLAVVMGGLLLNAMLKE